MAVLELGFWLSLFAIIYPYLGYPTVLWIFSTIRTNPIKKENITPFVSLVISAYNEEEVIVEKIKNSLGLNYSEDFLEIAIISDGSKDMTNDIIRVYAKKDNKIRPCISAVNKGKTSCLNDVVPFLKGDVILFTDANSLFDVDVINNIVRPFADPAVGFVTGITKYLTISGGQNHEFCCLPCVVGHFQHCPGFGQYCAWRKMVTRYCSPSNPEPCNTFPYDKQFNKPRITWFRSACYKSLQCNYGLVNIAICSINCLYLGWDYRSKHSLVSYFSYYLSAKFVAYA